MISLEKRAIIGEVETKLYGKTGILSSYRKTKNLTTTGGFQATCDMMGSSTALRAGFAWCGVGTGNSAPAIGNTTLNLESTRVQGGYTRSADTIWRNDATFGAGVGTGTLVESGMFDQGPTINTGTMLCRQTFGAITKGASDTLVVTWQYTLS